MVQRLLMTSYSTARVMLFIRLNHTGIVIKSRVEYIITTFIIENAVGTLVSFAVENDSTLETRK